MRSCVIALALLWSATVTWAQQAPAPSDPRLTACLVSLIQEVQIPAQEAGVVQLISVDEGSTVKKDEVLAKIDDSLAQAQFDRAKYEYHAAKRDSDNDVDIRFAVAGKLVAEAEHDAGREAVQQVPGAISESEMRRRKFQVQRSELGIEQAQHEQELSKLTVQARKAEAKAALLSIQRREVKSPLDGMVVEMLKHEGEWVNPGDPIMHVVRMDRLRVEGFLNAEEFAHHEVGNRPVTVEVKLARGRVEQFTSTIKFVSPEVQLNGEYRVWAEVENRREGEHWLLRPGVSTEMTIHLENNEI